ncbi:MAG: hypothetical protein WCF65_04790, partial [Parachlamydiaceae bacterium]
GWLILLIAKWPILTDFYHLSSTSTLDALKQSSRFLRLLRVLRVQISSNLIFYPLLGFTASLRPKVFSIIMIVISMKMMKMMSLER